jgi:hypothetical protein
MELRQRQLRVRDQNRRGLDAIAARLRGERVPVF